MSGRAYEFYQREAFLAFFGRQSSFSRLYGSRTGHCLLQILLNAPLPLRCSQYGAFCIYWNPIRSCKATNIGVDMLSDSSGDTSTSSHFSSKNSGSSNMMMRRPSSARRRRSPSSAPSSLPRRMALIATAVSALLGTALLANLFALQRYERALSSHGYAGVTAAMMGGSRSLRLSQQSYAAPAAEAKLPIRKADTEQLNCAPAMVPHKPEPEGLKMAWLMSFPNSGTSFTSRLVRDATRTDSASNYADETPTGQNGLRLPVYEDQPDGPFWIKPEANPEFTEPTEYVITKVRFMMLCALNRWISC